MSGRSDEDIYRFNGLKLSLRTRELIDNGETIPLESKVWDCLVYLLRHRDRAVSKDELREVIWQNRPLSDTVISRCIMKARRAIRDDGQRQTSIRTIPGYGYRFSADIRHDERKDPEVESMPDITPKPSRPGFSRKRFPGPRYLLPVLLLLVIALSIPLYILQDAPGNKADEGRQVAVLPVRNNTGDTGYDWMETGLMSLMEESLKEEGGMEVVPHHFMLSGGRTNSSGRGVTVLNNLAGNGYAGHGKVIEPVLAKARGIFRLDYQVYLHGKVEISDSLVGESPVTLAESAGRRIAWQLQTGHEPVVKVTGISTDSIVRKIYERGYLAFLDGDYRTARYMYRTALGLEPGADGIRLQLARVQNRLGQESGARELLNEMLSITEQDNSSERYILTLNTFGEVEWRSGRYEEARKYFERAMQLAQGGNRDRVLPVLLVNHARALIQHGERDGIIDILKQAVELGRENRDIIGQAAALRELGRMYYINGRTSVATDYMNRALNTFYSCRCGKEEEIATLVEMGKVHRAAGRIESSEGYLSHALRLSREKGIYWQEARSLIHLAHLRMMQGQIGESSEFVRESLELINEHSAHALLPIVHLQKAVIQAYSGNIRQAIAGLERVRTYTGSFEDDFSRTMIALKLGRLHLIDGSVEVAKKYADEGFSMAKDMNNRFLKSVAYRLKANIAHRNKDLDSAEILYREALVMIRELEHKQIETEILIDLGRVCLQKGKFEQTEILLASVNNSEKNHNALLLKAHLYYRLGKFDEAVTVQSKAREMAEPGAWNEQAKKLTDIYRTAARTGEPVELDNDYVALLP